MLGQSKTVREMLQREAATQPRVRGRGSHRPTTDGVGGGHRGRTQHSDGGKAPDTQTAATRNIMINGGDSEARDVDSDGGGRDARAGERLGFSAPTTTATHAPAIAARRRVSASDVASACAADDAVASFVRVSPLLVLLERLPWPPSSIKPSPVRTDGRRRHARPTPPRQHARARQHHSSERLVHSMRTVWRVSAVTRR
jgi:hypothetical protein